MTPLSPSFAVIVALTLAVLFKTQHVDAFGSKPFLSNSDTMRGGSALNSKSHDGKNNQEENDEGIFYISPEQRNELLSSSPSSSILSDLASKIKHTYDTQGYVLIRGLIDPKLLRRLQSAGDRVAEETRQGSTFSAMKFGAVFSSPPVSPDGDDSASDDCDIASYREVALESAIPAFISQVLLQQEEGNGSLLGKKKNTNLRVLNDAFLAKTGKEESFCGWHVDDSGFWPCSAHQDPEVPVGVNAWIAIDNIPAKTYGGGMAIVPKSHSEDCEWKQRGYEAIGSTPTYPKKGFSSISELFAQFGKTCGIAQLDPELNSQIEPLKKVFDYQQGDVLLMSRWLWHRSMQLNKEGQKHYRSDGKKEGSAFRRYTIRYECGHTRLLDGASIHPSVLYDASNAGKTLDQVCASSGLPFFPQAYPCVLESEMSKMKQMEEEILPLALKKRNDAIAAVRQAVLASKAADVEAKEE